MGLSMDNAAFLNSIYKSRYPSEEWLLPHGETSKEDAGRALSSAKDFMEKLKKNTCDLSINKDHSIEGSLV